MALEQNGPKDACDRFLSNPLAVQPAGADLLKNLTFAGVVPVIPEPRNGGQKAFVFDSVNVTKGADLSTLDYEMRV